MTINSENIMTKHFFPFSAQCDIHLRMPTTMGIDDDDDALETTATDFFPSVSHFPRHTILTSRDTLDAKIKNPETFNTDLINAYPCSDTGTEISTKRGGRYC